MKFVTQNAPAQRSKNSTYKIMLILLIGLIVVWISSIIYHFVGVSTKYGIRAITVPLVAILAILVSDSIVASIRYKKDQGPYGEYLLKKLMSEFSYITALIFALTLPAWTPYYVVAVGAIFATVVGKHLFGGFGNNIFNPAAVGRIFVTLAFGGTLAVPSDLVGTASGLASTGSTITTAFNSAGGWYTGNFSTLNVSLWDVWSGNYLGALGETFTLLILVIGIAFVALKVINWRTPVFYLGTVALTSIVIALITGAPVGSYLLLQLGLGGMMFGAIFMLTDPVTAPTSPFGKALIGVIAGLINVLIRVQGNYPEGTIFAIAIANMLTPLIDGLTKHRTDQKTLVKWAWVGGLMVVSMALNAGLSVVHAKDFAKPTWPEDYPDHAYLGAVGISEEEYEDYEVKFPEVSPNYSAAGVNEILEFYKKDKLNFVAFRAVVEGYSSTGQYGSSEEADLKFYVGFDESSYLGFAHENNETPNFGGVYLDNLVTYLPGVSLDKPFSEIETETTELKPETTITRHAVLSALELIVTEYQNQKLLSLFDLESLGDYAFNSIEVASELADAGVYKVVQLLDGEQLKGQAYYATVEGYSSTVEHGTSKEADLNFKVGFVGENYSGFIANHNETATFGGEYLTGLASYLPGVAASTDKATIEAATIEIKPKTTVTRTPVLNTLEIIAADYVSAQGL